MRYIYLAAIIWLPTFAAADEPPTHPAQLDQLRDPRVWVGGSVHETRIYEVLDSSLSDSGLDFREAPLESVAEHLRDEYGINVVLDNRALDELGLSSQEPISFRIKQVSLRSALTLMLRPFDLTYTVENEVLVITSVDQEIGRQRTAVYPVGDLLTSDATVANLIELLQSSYSQEGWDRSPEFIGSYDASIVVRGTQSLHEYVAGTLKALREAKKLNPPRTPTSSAKLEVESSNRGGGQF